MNENESSKLIFNYRVQPGDRDEALVQYLNNHRYKKDLILEALRAYWSPIAIESEDEDADVERVAWEAVLYLQKQLNYLCILFDLDRSKLMGNITLGNVPNVSMPSSESSELSAPPAPKKEKKKTIIPRINQAPTTGYSAGTGFEDWD